MVDEIIIHGVDVSECEYLRKCILPDNIGCKIDDFLCHDKPNCYFKQLARKTQECEELKKELRELKLKHTTLQNRCQQLDGVTTKAKCYEQALDKVSDIIGCIKETSIIMPVELLALIFSDPLMEYKLDKGHTIMYDDIIITDEITGQQIYLDVILYSKGVFINGEIYDEQE